MYVCRINKQTKQIFFMHTPIEIRYTLTRDITPEECPWISVPISKNTSVVRSYTNCEFLSTPDNGWFYFITRPTDCFELPLDSVQCDEEQSLEVFAYVPKTSLLEIHKHSAIRIQKEGKIILDIQTIPERKIILNDQEISEETFIRILQSLTLFPEIYITGNTISAPTPSIVKTDNLLLIAGANVVIEKTEAV